MSDTVTLIRGSGTGLSIRIGARTAIAAMAVTLLAAPPAAAGKRGRASFGYAQDLRDEACVPHALRTAYQPGRGFDASFAATAGEAVADTFEYLADFRDELAAEGARTVYVRGEGYPAKAIARAA